MSGHNGAMSPRTEPSPADDRRHTRLLGALTVLMLAAWLLLLAPLPWSLGAGLAALAALVVLVPTVISSYRRGRRAMAVIAAVVGVPATLMVVTSALISLLFYGPMSQLQECRDTALTQKAQATCTQEVQDSVASWLSAPWGS